MMRANNNDRYLFFLFVVAMAFAIYNLYATEVLLPNWSSEIKISSHETQDHMSPTINTPQTRVQQQPPKILHWNTREQLKAFMQSYFQDSNLVCSAMKQHNYDQLHVTFGCRDLFQTSKLGTGNYIAGLYAMRLAAPSVTISCQDAFEQRSELILPWLTGTFVRTDNIEKLLDNTTTIAKDICGTIDVVPIGLLYETIQYELRRMAISLIGVPPKDHSTHDRVVEWLNHHEEPNNSQLALSFSATTAQHHPLLHTTNLQLDEVIIHFRCGDLMDSQHPRFGFLKYDALVKHIATAARSIGIVTQPFTNKAQSRASDTSTTKSERCRIVVMNFLAYVRLRFPHARVSLHNADSIALTYARMIVANQTIAGISTFGVFPAIASFGTGYVRLPDETSPTNKWLLNPERMDTTIMKDGLVLMEEPNVLMVRKVRMLWEEENGKEKILQWFRNATIVYDYR